MQVASVVSEPIGLAAATTDHRRMRLAALIDHVQPVVLAREHTLPLAESLVQLFPEGVLQRGLTVVTHGHGAVSLALTLVSASVQSGSWVAFVDLPEMNLAAVAEAMVPLERVACIQTGDQWAPAVGAMLGAFDLVVVSLGRRVGAADARRLAARARERGSVLIAVRGAVGSMVWPDAPDVTLEGVAREWIGLGHGHGHLQGITAEVTAEGRRGFARMRRAIVPLCGGPAVSSGGGPAVSLGGGPAVSRPESGEVMAPAAEMIPRAG